MSAIGTEASADISADAGMPASVERSGNLECARRGENFVRGRERQRGRAESGNRSRPEGTNGERPTLVVALPIL